MKTGLFFGTFNPVHRGHEALVSSFLSCIKIEELWVIVTPEPPHKRLSTLAAFRHRWNMLQLVFSDYPGLLISDIEQRIPPPHYTVKTLGYLKNCYPDRTFYLCIGGDSLLDLPNWYEFEKITDNADILVAERPDVPTAIPSELPASDRIHFCDHEVSNISSTGIRNAMYEGRKPGREELHPDVYDYICKNDLYSRGKLRDGY